MIIELSSEKSLNLKLENKKLELKKVSSCTVFGVYIYMSVHSRLNFYYQFFCCNLKIL